MASSTSLKSPKQTNLPKGRLVCFGDALHTVYELNNVEFIAYLFFLYIIRVYWRKIMSTECLIYPALQKFYNALHIIDEISNTKYIFETIPQIDSFFSEMRNITFVLQKSFNTPELKTAYEQEKDKFLNNEIMKWFNKTRTETIHEHPFQLEKALDVEFYLPNFSIKTTHIRLTIDNDFNFDDLYKKLKLFLDTHYSKSVEVYLSTTTTFLENGAEVDIYSVIQNGIKIMHSMVIELADLYPCNCRKCETLRKEIKKLINSINAKKLTFSVDFYYADQKLTTGKSIYTSFNDDYSLLSPPVSIKNSIWDIKNLPACDLSYLRIFALNHIAIARMQRKESIESELMPVFLIIYKNDMYSFYGPITGTNKSTFYRTIGNITKIVNNDDKIKAILILTEGYRYHIENLQQFQSMKYEDRIKKASSVVILCSLISRNFDKIYAIEIDYEDLFDDNYIQKQMLDIIEYNPENHTAYPIFQALHK